MAIKNIKKNAAEILEIFMDFKWLFLNEKRRLALLILLKFDSTSCLLRRCPLAPEPF